MRKLVGCIVLLFSFVLVSYSQTAAIKGTVADTTEGKTLQNAVVSLLRKSDSTLVAYTRTNAEGQFLLTNLRADSCVLLISFPRYADYSDLVITHGSDLKDLGQIILIEKSVLLKAVIVHSVGAIRVKGDTTEFVADSFRVKDGATVEDLLKQLPGLSVDSKGQITAQGKTVDKVLVDGEEFFGDDPTVATQNLGAKQVDKIQVFDTKTDQDQLKGIGGNADSKTVNIKLKEDAKKGYFGKLSAGTNLNNLNNAKLLYNNFQGKRKVAAFATKSTTTTGSLGYEDRNKLGIDNDFEYDEIGGYYFSFGGNDEFGDYGLQGLPSAYNAGALYSNKWNEEKDNLNLSYNYNRLGTSNVSSTLKETLLPDTIFYNNEHANSRGLKEQHVFTGKYEWKIDSLASIKISSSSSYRTTNTSTHTLDEALDENQQKVNSGDRTNLDDDIHKQSDNQLAYKQLFHKKGRQILATFRYSNIHDEMNESLFSNNKFFTNKGADSTAELIDQLKIGTGHSETFGARVIYNEPVSDAWNLVTEYSYNGNNSTSIRNTFEKDNANKYTVLDSLYSNDFDLHAYSNSGTVTLRYMGKKIKSAFGGGISAVQLGVNDLDNHEKHVYHFTNFTPQAQVNYSLKAQTTIGFRYSGTTRQPTLGQLQPIRDNNDPLNIFIGNPNLKVGFNHNFNLYYNSFQLLKSRYVYIGTGFNLMQNAFANNSTIDSVGRTTTMPVNVKGVNNYYFYNGFVSGQGDKKLIHEISSNINGGRSVTFINNEQSINTYTNLGIVYQVSYSVKDKYAIHIGPRIGRNISSSSLRKDVNNNYWAYGGKLNGYVMLPGKLELVSDIDLDLRQHIAAFAGNTDIIFWNAELSRKIFRDKSGKFIFRANDILNQNKGFNRVINSNFVTDERYERIGQYFMMTFEWSFSKMPGQKMN